jgi:hypothetical protein
MPRKASTSSTSIKKGQGEWKPAFLAQLQEGGSITAAATAVGVDRTTVWYARKADPDFARAVEEIAQWCVQRVEDTLYTRAVAGETTELIFFLKTRKPDIYGDKLRADQVEAIKREARQEVLAEMQREVSALAPAARKLLMAAIPSAA